MQCGREAAPVCPEYAFEVLHFRAFKGEFCFASLFILATRAPIGGESFIYPAWNFYSVLEDLDALTLLLVADIICSRWQLWHIMDSPMQLVFEECALEWTGWVFYRGRTSVYIQVVDCASFTRSTC